MSMSMSMSMSRSRSRSRRNRMKARNSQPSCNSFLLVALIYQFSARALICTPAMMQVMLCMEVHYTMNRVTVLQ